MPPVYRREQSRRFAPAPRTPSLLAVMGVIAVLFAPLKLAVPATIVVVVLTAILIARLRPGSATYNIFACRPASSSA
jgi:hypothetical protein